MEYHPGTIKSMNAWTPAIKYCIPTLSSKLLHYFTQNSANRVEIHSLSALSFPQHSCHLSLMCKYMQVS